MAHRRSLSKSVHAPPSAANQPATCSPLCVVAGKPTARSCLAESVAPSPFATSSSRFRFSPAADDRSPHLIFDGHGHHVTRTGNSCPSSNLYTPDSAAVAVSAPRLSAILTANASVPSSLVAAMHVPYVPNTLATIDSWIVADTPSTRTIVDVTSASSSSSCHSVRLAISASWPSAARAATALRASRSAGNSTSAIVEAPSAGPPPRGSTETHPAHISRRDSSGVGAGATRTHFSPPSSSSSSSSSCFASSFATAGAGGGGGTSRTGGGGTSRTGSGAASGSAASGSAASGSAAGAGAGSAAGAATSAPSSPSVFATCWCREEVGTGQGWSDGGIRSGRG